MNKMVMHCSCFWFRLPMFLLLIIFYLLWSHGLGAPKKFKPEERLLLDLKRKNPEAKVKAGAKLGNKLTQLYKKNKLSAEDVSQLLQTADEAGLDFKNPIRKKRPFEPEKATEPEEGTRDKNAAGSMDRFLRKNHEWNDLYWAQIPMKNPKRKNDNLEEKWMPFLLPHEWLSNYLLQRTQLGRGHA